MDVEPASSALAAHPPPPPPPPPDQEMTIDYELESGPVGGEAATETGGEPVDDVMRDDGAHPAVDAPTPSTSAALTAMESDAPRSSAPVMASESAEGAGPGEEAEEAEMADDEASAWDRDDSTTATVAGGSGDAGLASIEPTETGQSGDMAIGSAATHSNGSLADGAGKDAQVSTVIEPSEPVQAVEGDSLTHAFDSPGRVTNASDVQGGPEPIPSEVAVSAGEEADAEQSDVPHAARHKAQPDAAEATGGEGDGAAEPALSFSDPADLDRASVPFLRPLVDKAALIGIEIDVEEPAGPSRLAVRQAPAVLFTYDSTTYAIFCANPSSGKNDELDTAVDVEATTEDDVEVGDLQADESNPVLLTDPKCHSLYYGPLESLFSRLHDEFPELSNREDELVLDFDEIGIALAEDNVYSREVSLHDFDRIHRGCSLPGRLHARLYSQSRFSSGFNALAHHVQQQALAGAEADPDDTLDNGIEEEAEYDEDENVSHTRYEENVEDDEHHSNEYGPDEPFEGVEDVEDGEGRREGEQEQFDLERALAELDGDDLAAYVEGIAEDYILSEHDGREVRAEQDGELGNDHEGDVEGGAEIEVAVEGREEETGGGGDDLEGEGEEATGDLEEQAGEGKEPTGDGEVSTTELPEHSTQAVEAVESGEAQERGEGADETRAEGAADRTGSAPERGHDSQEAPIPDTRSGSTSFEAAEALAAGGAEASAGTTVSSVSGSEAAELAPAETATAEIQLGDDASTVVATDGALPFAETDVVVPAPGPNGTDIRPEGEAASNVDDAREGVESAVAPAEVLHEDVASIETAPAVASTEDPIDSDDVVIDYEEAFDGSSVPVATETPSESSLPLSAADSVPAPTSPKRRHDSLDTETVDAAVEPNGQASDAKRPRLAEPVNVSTA
ncbi:hypothetical protein JCM10212_001981 [Sporobolomyces blumeae]